MMTPHANEIITELRRTRDTTEIIDEESFNDVRYAKSPMHMNMEIKGIAQFHRNAVVFARVGYHYGNSANVIPSYASAGFGLKLFGVHLDFAYMFASEVLSNSMIVSLGYSF